MFERMIDVEIARSLNLSLVQVMRRRRKLKCGPARGRCANCGVTIDRRMARRHCSENCQQIAENVSAALKRKGPIELEFLKINRMLHEKSK